MINDTANNAMIVFASMMGLSLVLISAIVYLTSGVQHDWRRKGKLKINSPKALVTLGALSRHGELILLADGYTPSEMRYSYVMGLSLIFSPRPLYGLYTVELPFVASAHIVGLSRNDSFPARLEVPDSALEEMELEGDYPNYFSLYVDRGEQSEGRYVLDPLAMQYTVDFCKQFNWEILDDTLFFLSGTEIPSFEMVDRFIQEIRPAVDSGKKAVRHSHDLPYVTIQPLRMDCPICQVRMKPGREWLSCPDQHGILLEGKQMIRLRQIADADDLRLSLYGLDSQSERELICPHCKSYMKPNRFLNTHRYVDVCTSCRYRWLDYNETKEIVGVERTII